MSTYSKDKNIMKTIRISQVEKNNWDSDKIHSFLEGKLESIEHLKFYNDFFKDNIDYLMKNKDIDLFIEQNEKIFDEIEEMVK
jgi:hypothetical protein